MFVWGGGLVVIFDSSASDRFAYNNAFEAAADRTGQPTIYHEYQLSAT